jgi:hypothetical protein
MTEPDDLLPKVLEAAAAPGDASLADVHLALAAIAQELRTTNLIAAQGLLANTSEQTKSVKQEIAARLGRRLPPPGRGYL